jgi:sugar/nucleoside kinase (ribokinase family)
MTLSRPQLPEAGENVGHFALDVVGIGALNLDYVASAPDPPTDGETRPITARVAALLGERAERFDWGTEHHVDESTIHRAIELVSSTRIETVLGGSAFNAIHAIARTRVGLRLGYVGVAGRVPVTGMSIVQRLDALGVDRSFVVEDVDHACGICFSFSENGDRTLLTHAGANEHLAGRLASEFDALVEYLSCARIVHVTSFLDDTTAGWLLPLLRAVKEHGRRTLICFDPGHVWSVARTPEIADLIALSDFLLVNHREFRELGGYRSTESDEDVAARLLRRFDSDRGVVVVKRSNGIWCYRDEQGKLQSELHAQVPIAEDEIEDATGAGDVFAAGLLTMLACDRLQIELGSLLGMRLARHKLRYVGSSGHAQFAEVARSFIRTLDAQRRSGGPAKGVFIAHGANPSWLAVHHFVAERFGVPVYSFESSSWSGRQVTEALADYLERCSFAICVLTAEDFTEDGAVRARQNVIHEVGLFQGRHGFDRVVVLVEDGCEFTPKTAEPYTVRFPRNGINSALYELDAMIRARGIGRDAD